ncbi:peptide deformylase [bacterium]|nr:peptide deformylase [bacterium]
MSVLKIVKYGDKTLRTPSKEVAKISKKIQKLLDDMLDTLYKNDGVGLAAPQVGENLRIFIIDVSDPKDPPNPMVFINPKIIKKSGAINSYEGCLSFPSMYTNVRRYENVTVKALNHLGKPFVIEGKDGSLLARALQHEFDHLDGVLFIDHARNVIEASTLLNKHGLAPLDESKLLEEAELEAEIQSKPQVQIEEGE